ncbi:MAG: hypothetical protein K5854_02920 [Prevotella sp.]|nr:hypothetical protein [Prevotella sp.]
MRRYIYILAIVMAFIVSSCSNESYDTGDGIYSYLRADLVMAHSTSDKAIDYAITDDSQRIVFNTPLKANWIQNADTLYRAILYYKDKEEGAEPITSGYVPVFRIEPKSSDAIIDTMKTDPVKFESAWMSKNNRFLNISIGVKTGKTDNNKLQSIGVYSQQLTENSNGTRDIYIRLTHNQNDIPEYYTSNYYLSIDMANFKPTDKLHLLINTYKGEIEREFSPSPSTTEGDTDNNQQTTFN